MEVKASERLDKARIASESNQIESSIIYYFQAINWYSPIGSSQTAANELFILGETLTQAGQKQLAYQAFLRLRSALNAARSFYFPKKDLLEKSNYQIALYLAAEKLGPSAKSNEINAAVNRYFQIYQNSPETNEIWYLLILLSFFLWSISAIRSIFTLFNNENTPLRNKISVSKIPLSLFVIGYALWIITMRIA
jgi:tetratricopeptide (TPR) repeat protein